MEDWAEEGICHAPENAHLWEKFFAESAVERREARNLCFQCPVRLECLTTALENLEIWGVWGGCDESELRRALWVDANGDYRARCRFPHCPFCKARPSRLVVVSLCTLPAGKRRDQVQCVSCGLTWGSGWSVQAVKAYWRHRTRQRQLRAKAPRGRVPSHRVRGSLAAVPSADAPAAAQTADERQAVMPMVASAGSRPAVISSQADWPR